MNAYTHRRTYYDITAPHRCPEDPKMTRNLPKDIGYSPSDPAYVTPEKTSFGPYSRDIPLAPGFPVPASPVAQPEFSEQLEHVDDIGYKHNRFITKHMNNSSVGDPVRNSMSPSSVKNLESTDIYRLRIRQLLC